ncbi:MAG TPA: Na+/H+ antiporter subunit E [Miltoncostaeaceae bacterium]|nr:Na+/H+ antiporter subunit E [Miltoncostaeaceae bacterium]
MSRAAALRAGVRRLLLLALLWWAVTGTAAPGWGLGGLVALASVGGAAALSVWLVPPAAQRLRLRALPAFAAYFGRRSLAGGVDVARRALLPGGGVRPWLVEVATDLPPGAPRALLVATVSLLPGTLVARVHDDLLEIHVLDTGIPVEDDLRRTEALIRRLFGIRT